MTSSAIEVLSTTAPVQPQERLVIPTLERIVRAQTETYIEFGFHEALGLSAPEFRLSLALPKDVVLPWEFDWRFGRPLIVLPGISIAEQHSLVGIKNPGPERAYADLTPAPKLPYLILISDPIPAKTWYDQPKSSDEVGSTFHEVTAAWIHHRELFLDKEGKPSVALIAAGTRLVSPGGKVEAKAPDIRYFHKDSPLAGLGFTDRFVSGWYVSMRSPHVVILGPQPLP